MPLREQARLFVSPGKHISQHDTSDDSRSPAELASSTSTGYTSPIHSNNVPLELELTHSNNVPLEPEASVETFSSSSSDLSPVDTTHQSMLSPPHQPVLSPLGLFLSKCKYALNLLTKTLMHQSKPFGTPLAASSRGDD
ncbi:hypothetical protein ACLOJK_034695 [Asimina triloba]